MKKSLWLVLLLVLVCTFALSACDDANQPQTPNSDHIHAFGEWTTTKKANCTEDGINERYCACGEKQTQSVSALGHTKVIDDAVAATCTTDGKTEGKHCSVCSEVIVAQTTIGKLGHVEVIDTAVTATCTTDGKTEGKHCSRCSAVLISQTVLSSSGHKYNNGEVTTQATCNQSGVKTFTCTVNSCRHSYTENYSLATYTATELYNISVKYVGEIVTYDRSGAELALGTGFVISSDGKIVTNYHVIEGAYSANITINNKKYTITTVLAYDENIDLAVVKVNATGLTAATVCKNPVNVGSTVYAIGSSRGMTNTYSQGIITYAERVVDGVSHVQHDASITHGNSGGPLINVYGEVIGINTWGISDSQNLNFAVFTGELDNLVYGTPMTLAEFYEANFNAYETLLNWLLENYNYTGDSWIEYRYQKSGERYSVYSLTYFYNTNTLSLVYYYVFNNDDARYVSIDLSEDSTSCRYYATYTDGDYSYKENVTQGYIYPSSFTRYTSIGYYSSKGDYWTLSSLLETYQEGIVYSLEWFDVFLDAFEFGLTLSDFGFNSFS